MAINYRRANRWLLGLIILINGYVIAAPLWPQLVFWFQNRTSHAAELEKQVDTPPPAAPDRPQPDTLTIPRMQFSGLIHQGSDTYAELEKGARLWPDGGTPAKGGNTVILAHRFTYTNPRGAFYFLDKLQSGDRIGLTYRNKAYTYVVSGSRVVEPTEVSILDPTPAPTLTLYTCTPLWNPTQRLVVTAKLEANP